MDRDAVTTGEDPQRRAGQAIRSRIPDAPSQTGGTQSGKVVSAAILGRMISGVPSRIGIDVPTQYGRRIPP
jgi:hypothetical protein